MKKVGLFIDTWYPMVDGVIKVVDNYARRLVNYCEVVVFCPETRIGMTVSTGQVLADIVDPLCGSVKTELVAPCNGVVFYAARTPLVNEGTLAFQLVPPDAGTTADIDQRGNFLDPEA